MLEYYVYSRIVATSKKLGAFKMEVLLLLISISNLIELQDILSRLAVVVRCRVVVLSTCSAALPCINISRKLRQSQFRSTSH
jgi:hypothetical protein